MLSDAEILCEFMGEPKPSMPEDCFDRAFTGEYLNEWWLLTTTGYEAGDNPVIVTVNLTLERLRLIEARLTDEQWGEYEQWLNGYCMEWPDAKPHWWAIHADAPTKERALAQLLRPLIEVVANLK